MGRRGEGGDATVDLDPTAAAGDGHGHGHEDADKRECCVYMYGTALRMITSLCLMTDVSIHIGKGMAFLSLRVMQGRPSLAPSFWHPGSPEVKDTRFEIDMAGTGNGIIIGKLVTALPGSRTVA